MNRRDSLQDLDDLALAKVAERGEALAWVDMARAATPEIVAALGLAVVSIEDGLALVASAFPSLLYNRAFGMGVERPFDSAALERAIALYRRDAPFSIQPCPLSLSDRMRESLRARGLELHHPWVKWVRGTATTPDARTELRIQPVGSEQAGAFADVAFTVFANELPVRPWLEVTIGRRGWSHYLAWDGGEPVAAAVLYVESELGWLGWGATLESHRSLGAQSALIARRVQDAATQGCRWVTVETAEDTPANPNPSFRNMERAGFRLLYHRPSFTYLPGESVEPV